jgi:hypothetical protein
VIETKNIAYSGTIILIIPCIRICVDAFCPKKRSERRAAHFITGDIADEKSNLLDDSVSLNYNIILGITHHYDKERNGYE